MAYRVKICKLFSEPTSHWKLWFLARQNIPKAFFDGQQLGLALLEALRLPVWQRGTCLYQLTCRMCCLGVLAIHRTEVVLSGRVGATVIGDSKVSQKWRVPMP